VIVFASNQCGFGRIDCWVATGCVGEVMSPLDAGVIRFRSPDGTIAELVQKVRYENLKKFHGVA
jgi:hypothetical protein